MGEEQQPQDPLRAIDPSLYDELRAIAVRCLRGETSRETPSATSVVHEIWLRLARSESQPANDSQHLLALASVVARRFLVDTARARLTVKRNGTQPPQPLPDQIAGGDPDPAEILAVDELLSRLEQLHPRQAKALEMRMFGDIDAERIGQALSISATQVKRDVAFARAWLSDQLTRSPGGSE
jgi:RNA polymerase sigma factor (TIGR02999 family)